MEKNEDVFEFNDDGFLTERSGFRDSLTRGSKGDLFSHAYQINRDCHRLLFSTKPHNKDGQELLVAAAFIRALEHFQASLLLLRNGLVAPGKVEIRATLEAIFTTRALAVNEGAVEAFIKDDLYQRRKLINKAQSSDDINFEDLKNSVTDEMIKALNNEIKKFGVTHLSTEDLSRLAGMHRWYLTAYTLLSKAVHTHVRDLECYMVSDQEGQIRSFLYAPSIEDIPELLLTASHYILIGGDAVAKTFNLEFPSLEKHSKFIHTELASHGKSELPGSD